MSTYKYLRAAATLPPAQLKHVDLTLRFFEDRVEAAGTLSLVAREPLASLDLDAKALEIVSCSLPCETLADQNKLRVRLPQTVQIGEEIAVSISCVSHPSATIFDGIYRDVTPPGDHPQQYMSQCEQWGFQRIFPIIDDCTAKCTFRTTLVGDARYTHLISNGDQVSDETVGGVRTVTYVNSIPMAPYLFIACAGTWETLVDSLTLPNGRTIRLEYLVPPGKLAGAHLPMAILKRAVLWQHQTLGFVYPYAVYRTITMEKSNFGGMENVGNTTIISEAATIDEAIDDARRLYAYGVIVHEYEHSHCGSGVTMKTPFDMWLNEAYTVAVEQDFVATIFDPAFLRVRDVDALRLPDGGPLAEEDAGRSGQIVREGFNDPDEVVDGVTYDKAPEVLRMLEKVMGPARYREATALYFSRFDGGNADTEDFLNCLREVAGDTLDVTRFADAWLYHAGYPCVTATWRYEDATRTFCLHLEQRPNLATIQKPYILPFAVAAVDANGHDLFESIVVFDTASADFTFSCSTEPALASLNRNASFYGRFTDLSATPAQLRRQVLMDPNGFNRVQAMRRLVDLERARYMKDPAAYRFPREFIDLFVALDALVFSSTQSRKGAESAENVYGCGEAVATCLSASLHLCASALNPAALASNNCSLALASQLLSVNEIADDPALYARPDLGARFRRLLLARVAAVLPCAQRLAELSQLESHSSLVTCHSAEQAIEADAAAIPRRALMRAYTQLLAAQDTPVAWAALKAHLARATQLTDRLQTLEAIWRSSDPEGETLLMREKNTLCASLNGKIGWYRILGTKPTIAAVEVVLRELAKPDFPIAHPGISRALLLTLPRNHEVFWSEEGMRAFVEALVRLAAVSEYTANRLLGAVQIAHALAPELRLCVQRALCTAQERLAAVDCPWVKSKIASLLCD